MKPLNATPGKAKSASNVVLLFTRIKTLIAKIFTPEEVEVTFEEDHGKITGYTYKVTGRHAA